MSSRVASQQTSLKSFALPGITFIAVVYLFAISVLLFRSFTDPEPGVGNYVEMLSSSGFQNIIWNTVFFSALAAMFSILIGYPIAYVIAQSSGGFRMFLMVCIATPWLTSILIRTFSWQVILGRQGPINGFLEFLGLEPLDLLFNGTAVVIGMAHSQIPLVVLALVPIIARVDHTQLSAARSLGAGPAEAFVRVFLPATKPGIQVGFVLAFVYNVGNFAIPALLGGNRGRMVGSYIHSLIETVGNYTNAATAAAILSIVVLLVLWLFSLVSRQKIQSVVAPQLAAQPAVAADASTRAISLGVDGEDAASRKTSKSAITKVRAPFITEVLGRIARGIDRTRLSSIAWLPKALAVVLAFGVMIPQLIAIPISFAGSRSLVFPPNSYSLQWYENFFAPKWIDPTVTSLRISIIVAIVATLLGVLSAIGIARSQNKIFSSVFTPYLLIPLIFPTVVAAGAFYIAYLYLGLNDTELGIILAHVSITLPQAFALTYAAMLTINPDLERAALSLGAKKSQVLTRVLFPLLTGSVIAALGLTFITSFDESTIAVFLSGVDVKTLPRRVFEAMALETDPTIGVTAVLFMAVIAVGAILYWVIKTLRKRALQSGRK